MCIMRSVLKVALLLLSMLTVTVGLNGVGQVKSTNSKNNVPKRVIINKDFISVNSRDTIKVEIVKFPLLSDAQQGFVERAIAKYRSPYIMKFIETFSNRDRVEPFLQSNMSFTQEWYYQIVYQSKDELAFKLMRYEYTGGAHGNTTAKNFNLDLTNLKDIKFSDKFKALDPEKVAQYCTAYLHERDIPIFDDKVKVYPDFFKIWNFTGEGLLLTFPQYTIAPYSSGLIEVHIPRSDLVMLRRDR